MDWWRSFLDLCDSTKHGSLSSKALVLALWWALWKSKNNFNSLGREIKPLTSINIALNFIVNSNDKHEDARLGPIHQI